MTTTPFRPVIRTQRDVERAWCVLSKDFPSAEPLLQLMLIGPDDQPIPQLIEIEAPDRLPDAEEQHHMGLFLREVLAELLPGGRVAILRCRPGGDHITADDRVWAQGLYEACRAGGVPCETIHLATPRRILPLPLDELGIATG